MYGVLSVLTTHHICAVALTVSYKQTMPFFTADGPRTRAISLTVEYTLIEADSLDDPAKGETLETSVF